MLDTIIIGLTTAFNAVSAFMLRIFESTGTAFLVLGTLFAMFVVRFIIYPGLKGGVGSSDKASRSRVLDAEYKELE